MSRERETQRKQSQVAAGRVFQDRPAFVSKPEKLTFKDFVVGKVPRTCDCRIFEAEEMTGVSRRSS